MRRLMGGVVLAGLAMTAIGCATPQEWSDWKGHSSHFASGDHMGFSIRNREGAATRVTRADVAAARTQEWWGKAITVDQGQVLEN